MGASTQQIIFKVLIPEALPSIIQGITLMVINLVAYSAMAGAIGVKVWIYRGDVFDQDKLSMYNPTTPSRSPRRGSDRRDGGHAGGFDRRDSTVSKQAEPTTAPAVS